MSNQVARKVNRELGGGGIKKKKKLGVYIPELLKITNQGLPWWHSG